MSRNRARDHDGEEEDSDDPSVPNAIRSTPSFLDLARGVQLSPFTESLEIPSGQPSPVRSSSTSSHRGLQFPEGSYFDSIRASAGPARTAASSFMRPSAIAPSARKAELEQATREVIAWLKSCFDVSTHPNLEVEFPSLGRATIPDLRAFLCSRRLTELVDDARALRLPSSLRGCSSQSSRSSSSSTGSSSSSSSGGGGTPPPPFSSQDAEAFRLFQQFMAAHRASSSQSVGGFPASLLSSQSTQSTQVPSPASLPTPSMPRVHISSPDPHLPTCCVRSPGCRVSSDSGVHRCVVHGRLESCRSSVGCPFWVPVSELFPCSCGARGVALVPRPLPDPAVVGLPSPFQICDPGKLRLSFNWSLIHNEDDRIFLRQFSDALLTAVAGGSASPNEFPLGNWIPLSAVLVAQANSFVLEKDLVLPAGGVVCMANTDSAKKRKERVCRTPLDTMKATESFFRMLSVFYPSTAGDNDAMCRLLTIDLWAETPDQDRWRRIVNHFVEGVRIEKAHLPVFKWSLSDPSIMVKWIEAKALGVFAAQGAQLLSHTPKARADDGAAGQKRAAPARAAELVPHWHNVARKNLACIAQHLGKCKFGAKCFYSHDPDKFAKDITSPAAIALEEKQEAPKDDRNGQGAGARKRK